MTVAWIRAVEVINGTYLPLLWSVVANIYVETLVESWYGRSSVSPDEIQTINPNGDVNKRVLNGSEQRKGPSTYHSSK